MPRSPITFTFYILHLQYWPTVWFISRSDIAYWQSALRCSVREVSRSFRSSHSCSSTNLKYQQHTKLYPLLDELNMWHRSELSVPCIYLFCLLTILFREMRDLMHKQHVLRIPGFASVNSASGRESPCTNHC